MVRVLIIVAMTASIVAPSMASAQPEVALFPLELEGELEGVPTTDFVEALATGFDAENLEIIPPDQVSAATGLSTVDLSGCQTADCLTGALGDCAAHLALRVELEASVNIYSFRLEALSPTGRRLTVAEDGCELCTRAEAIEALVQLARQVAAGLPRTAALSLSTTPADVLVTIDGAPVEGEQLELPPGDHHVEIEAPGYQTSRREVHLVLGEPSSLDVELEAAPRPPPPNGRRRLGALGIAGLVLTIGGTLTLGVGIGTLVIDGNCAGGRRDINDECEFIYSTLRGSVAALSLGAAVAAAGAVLMIIDRARTPEVEPDAGLSLDRLAVPRLQLEPVAWAADP